MRMHPLRIALAILVFTWLFVVALFAQTNKTPDDSTELQTRAENEDIKASGADVDDPTTRLEWERKAWGTANLEFRQHSMREGDEHSRRKKRRGPTWVSIGPTGADYEQNGSFTGHVRDSGRARTILPHPTNPNIVYFLTSGGGLWKTTNWTSSHARWTPLTDDLPTTGGGAVAFGRTTNVLYLGLGDPYDQILVGGSVVKSVNGGESWSRLVELGTAVSVRDLKVDTSGWRDVVLVATDSGLYRSADGGQTYSAVGVFAGQSVWSIVRTSAGWLASAQPCAAASVGLQCGQTTTLYLSTDLGATWNPITNTGNVFNGNGRTTLGVGVPGDSVVYAYAANVKVVSATGVVTADNAMRDVYRSSDGGQTWVANNVNSSLAPTNPNPVQPKMDICDGQCWYNQMIVVDPQDPTRNTLWIGGNLASAKSTNGGGSWTLQTWWLYNQFPDLRYAHADFHAAAFKTNGGGPMTLVLGNDGGLNVTDDNGATFTSDKNNGLVTHLYYTITGNAALPNLVLGGLQDNGTRLRTGNDTIHNQVIGGDGMGAAYSQANTNTVLGSAQGSSMRTNLSNNPPEVFQNWAGATSGLSDVGFGFFTAILPAPSNLDPTGRVFFHFSNSRVWRSNNGGLNWGLIAGVPLTGFPGSPGLPAGRRFRSSPYNIGVSPTDLSRIAVGAAGGFLDITTDGGATWVDINLIAQLPPVDATNTGYQGFVTNVNWQDNQNLWITSVAQATGATRVIKASIANPGDSWATATFTRMQNDLPDLPVTRILFDPRDASRNTIYAATHVGIYRSTNGGANWSSYGNGLPTVRVNDIYMPPDGGFMRIATYGRGVWELPQIEFARAALKDDARSCDRDGVLDNGETGHLIVTLKNQGSREVDHIYAVITSSNPNVTFPLGNIINFPSAEGNDEVTGRVKVRLSGAAGIDATDFTIAVSAPELGLPSALNVVSTHRLNYDEALASASVESAEASHNVWTAAGDAIASPNVASWQVRALSATQHVFWGPDNNGQADGIKGDLPDQQSLVSPTLHVGAGPLTISFDHRFSFESGGWDGGVVEISRDGGSTWTDAGAAYNGSTRADTDTPIGASRPAFVNRSAGWPSFLIGASINLGTAYANQDILVRFRIGADSSTGAPGWEIDNINVSGLTSTPFTAVVANAGVCLRGGHEHDD